MDFAVLVEFRLKLVFEVQEERWDHEKGSNKNADEAQPFLIELEVVGLNKDCNEACVGEGSSACRPLCHWRDSDQIHTFEPDIEETIDEGNVQIKS